jgi:hypothetical protein
MVSTTNRIGLLLAPLLLFSNPAWATGFDFTTCRPLLKLIAGKPEKIQRSARLNIVGLAYVELTKKARTVSEISENIEGKSGRVLFLLNAIPPRETSLEAQRSAPDLQEVQALKAAAEAADLQYSTYAKRYNQPGTSATQNENFITQLASYAQWRHRLVGSLATKDRPAIAAIVEETGKRVARRLEVDGNSDEREARALEKAIARNLTKLDRFDVDTESKRLTKKKKEDQAALAGAQTLKMETENLMGGWRLEKWTKEEVHLASNILAGLQHLALRRYFLLEALADQIPETREIGSFLPDELRAALPTMEKKLAAQGDSLDWADPLRSATLDADESSPRQARALQGLLALSTDPRVPPDIQEELKHNIRFLEDFRQTPPLRLDQILRDIRKILGGTL